MAKKIKEKKSEEKAEQKKSAKVEDIKTEPPKDGAIVITETEEDMVLATGFNGDPNGLKEEIKKEAAKSDVLSRFLIPLFTFLFIGLIVGGLTWYYARPEVTNQKSQEEKIETPPTTATTPAPATTTTTKPTTPAATTPAAQPTTYTVQSGDTLSSIANANGLTSKQLADYNGITNADSLTIGQTLKIPPK